MPNSFVFDANKCTGCGACRLACSIENQLAPEQSWRSIETFNPRRHQDAPLYHLSLACNHCDEPVCMYACPALAYRRDSVTGAVLLDENKCIGCRYCSWACPFDAPVFDRERGVMSKCTFCNHRLHDGLKPACASLCPTGALDFGDLPESELENEVDGFPSTDLGPRIRIDPLKPGRRLPVMTATEVASPFVELGEQAGSPRSAGKRIALETEWSLLVFTTLSAALVAVVAAGLKAIVPIAAWQFAGASALAMGLGALHLGRPGRSYRAILNLRRSWLSREVVTTSAFFGLGTAYLWRAPESQTLGATAVLVGFLGLFCADRVYGVFKTALPAYRHSASVLWTGLLLTGVFTGTAWLAGILGFGKLSLYVLRKLEFIDRGRPVRPIVSAARAGLGLVLPAILWLIDFNGLIAYVIGAVLLGEVIDRCEYYVELEPESPSREMARDFAKEIATREPAIVG
jgi:Fe-S-cluster-containing dehydrogenase component